MMFTHQTTSPRKDILVVDDAPENLRILLDALSEHGYSVRCARSGNLAIAGSQAAPPDLVLLDILMPQMDGYEVCHRLKQDVKTSDVPIIFLSALDDGNDKARAFAIGGDDYIAKPFNIDEVLARVRHQLDLRQRQTQLQQWAKRYRLANRDLQNDYIFIQKVLNSLPEGIAAFQPLFDDNGDVTDFKAAIANAAFLQFVHEASATASTNEENTFEDDNLQTLLAHRFNCELFDLCVQVIESNESIRRELLYLKGNKQQWVEVFATKLQDSVVTSLKDISDSKAQIRTLEAKKQEFYALATTDVLTQVSNRYQFDSYFVTEWQRSLREQQPLSLLIADIDKFKRFNDICGHHVGDRCLREVARVLQSIVRRPTDLIARYGGEEFAIVLPNTFLRGAIQIANDIQAEIRNLNLANIPSTECKQVHISIGISCALPQLHQSPLELIEAADRAMYKAKSLGGNTSCVEMI